MANILLIEDDAGILMVGRRTLEGMGHSVTTAEDAETALREFSKHKFDLVITDLKVPGQTGLSTVLKMRKLKKHQPIIVTSGSDLYAEDFRKEVKAVGGVRTLSKPYDLPNFMSAVEDALT